MVNGLSSMVNYQYDSANRLTSVDNVNYTFDDNGNLLSDGTNTYSYDSANRLIAISGQQSASYTYNGLGDRLSQTVNSETTNYTLDMNSGLTQVLDDEVNSYTYGLGRISQLNTDTLVTDYFLGDALGSVRQLTSNVGNITLAKSYDPYGNVTHTTGTAQTTYGFTSETTDVSGLVYLRARYYSPLDGRFMSRDTFGGNYNSPLSLNRWNYVDGNPIRFADPTGHIKEDYDEAKKAFDIVIRLRTYNVNVLVDWGYYNWDTGALTRLIPKYNPANDPYLNGLFGNCWRKGRWHIRELELLEFTIKKMNTAMYNQFSRLYKPTTVIKSITSDCSGNWRGCTSHSGDTVWFFDNFEKSIPSSPNSQKVIDSKIKFDPFTMAHEFGHVWDQQNNNKRSEQLVLTTGGSYSLDASDCHISDNSKELNYKKPGCNDAGYVYGGIPSYGAGQTFDAREDFANSVAAYVFPVEVQQEIANIYGNPAKVEKYKLHDFLYYDNYKDESRWMYVNKLVKSYLP